MKRCVVILASVVLCISTWRAALAQTAVTECGQVVPRGQSGQLVGDLDCSALENHAVTLDSGAKLFLNGFTLTGYPASTSLAVVRCLRRCRIEGPGTITGGNYGVRGEPPWPPRGHTNIRIRGTTVSGNLGLGVSGRWLKLKIEGSTITNNLYGAGGDRVKIEGSTITNNLGGVGGRARITESTVSNNDWYGVFSFHGAVIEDSEIVDNGLDPDCPAENGHRCGDILLGETPRLVGTTTCGTSLNLSAEGFGCYETWGVCAEDPEFGLCEQPQP